MIDREFVPEGPYLVNSASGRVDLEDVLTAIAGWFQDPNFDPTISVVWDLRACFLDLTLDELSSVYDRVRDNVDTKRQGGRTAWVHDSQLIGSMILIVGDAFDWGSEWGSFASIQDAVQWCLEGSAD